MEERGEKRGEKIGERERVQKTERERGRYIKRESERERRKSELCPTADFFLCLYNAPRRLCCGIYDAYAALCRRLLAP